MSHKADGAIHPMDECSQKRDKRTKERFLHDAH